MIAKYVLAIVGLMAFTHGYCVTYFLEAAEYRGKVMIGRELSDYELSVAFSNQSSPSIERFDLSIGGKKVSIPIGELRRFGNVTRVDPPMSMVSSPGHIRVRIFGGDAAKAYEVHVITSREEFIKLEWRKRGEGRQAAIIAPEVLRE